MLLVFLHCGCQTKCNVSMIGAADVFEMLAETEYKLCGMSLVTSVEK